MPTQVTGEVDTSKAISMVGVCLLRQRIRIVIFMNTLTGYHSVAS
jgi:hypothetical protein